VAVRGRQRCCTRLLYSCQLLSTTHRWVMSKPSAVATRPGPSLTPMLASADDTMPPNPSRHVRRVQKCLGHNHGHEGRIAVVTVMVAVGDSVEELRR
jgi:hypothetical protein